MKNICTLLALFLSVCATAQNKSFSCGTHDLNAVSNSTALQSNSSCNDYTLSVDEIVRLPIATVKVAFHFVGNRAGRNFTNNPNDPIVDDNWHWYAGNTLYLVMREMNKITSSALIGYNSSDTRIRFAYVNGSSSNSSYFYSHGQSINYRSDAMNIVFKASPYSGYTNYGANWVVVSGLLESVIADENEWWTAGRTAVHEFLHTKYMQHGFNCNNPCDGVDINVRVECGGTCYPDDSGGECYGRSTSGLDQQFSLSVFRG